jgi:hypothetical protein
MPPGFVMVVEGRLIAVRFQRAIRGCRSVIGWIAALRPVGGPGCWEARVSERKQYPSDLSDDRWALIEPGITAWKATHSPAVAAYRHRAGVAPAAAMSS